MMFEDALKAHIPILGVVTDDVVNFTACLQLIAGIKVVECPKTVTGKKTLGPYLFWTFDMEDVSVEMYRHLVAEDKQLVVINPSKPQPLVFDAGVLPTPPSLIRSYLLEVVSEEDLDDVQAALKGLSLKAASEVLQLTQVQTGSALPKDIRKVRSMLGGSVQGLYPVDADIDFYVQPSELEEYLKVNTPYFQSGKTPMKLVPRGLMLSGPPGVGKTMAAKAIAKHFGVPLFRLDISTTLNKYIGESENRVARSLSMVERESPCVLLIDEVEKVLRANDDQGVTSRILNQLLWWLADHPQRVFTVMTTNNLGVLPLELYRPGRLDRVMEIQKLNMSEAKLFAIQVFKSIIGKAPTVKQGAVMGSVLETKGPSTFSHSEVADVVFSAIKEHKWLPFDIF